MAEIVKFTGDNFFKIKPKDILKKATKWDMESCLIIGLDENSELICGGTTCELGDILVMLELAKKFVIDNKIARTA